jgi:hypothetical protein
VPIWRRSECSFGRAPLVDKDDDAAAAAAAAAADLSASASGLCLPTSIVPTHYLPPRAAPARPCLFFWHAQRRSLVLAPHTLGPALRGRDMGVAASLSETAWRRWRRTVARRPGLRCTERAETRRRRAVGRVRAWVRRPLHRRCTRALHRRRWPGTRSLAGLPIPLRRIAQVCSMTTADAANPTACPRGHPRFVFHAPLSAMGASTHTRNKAGCSVFLTQSGRPQPL